MYSTLSPKRTTKDGHKKRSKLRRTTISVLSHAYNLAADIADERIDSQSTRGVAAGTAASLLSIGLEKVSSSGSASMIASLAEVERSSILDIEADRFDSDMSFDENYDSSSSSRRSSFSDSANAGEEHFMDKLLERLLIHAIPHKERENLSLKLHDPDRTKKPNLSIRIMVKNFRKLSSRMNGLFEIQYGVIHVLTWKHPTVTLSALVLFTSVCIYPHFLLIIPLLYLLYGVMVPSYIYRHPLERAEIRKVKKRGKSIFDFFVAENDANKIVRESIDVGSLPRHAADTKASKDEPTTSGKSSVNHDDLEKMRKSAKTLKNQMELLINMRDLQNLTSDVINSYDQVERFWYGTGGFSDERVSTSLFLSLLGYISVVLFFGSYIPWRIVFIFSGWALVASCHPSSLKRIQNINKTYLAPQKKRIDKTMQRSEIKDIILDEPPMVKQVEIFELEEQGWTPSQWNSYCFTDDCFDYLSKLKKQLPSGCSMINEVLPPSSWKFDEERSWQVDNLALWARGRVGLRSMGDGGWVYDVDGTNVGRWRRRRLTRDCYRYARPAKRARH